MSAASRIRSFFGAQPSSAQLRARDQSAKSPTVRESLPADQSEALDELARTLEGQQGTLPRNPLAPTKAEPGPLPTAPFTSPRVVPASPRPTIPGSKRAEPASRPAQPGAALQRTGDTKQPRKSKPPTTTWHQPSRDSGGFTAPTAPMCEACGTSVYNCACG